MNWERYFEMIIYQAELNEEKLGSTADSVGSKIRDKLPVILQGLKVLDLVKERCKYLEDRRDEVCYKAQSGNDRSYCDCEYCCYYDEHKCMLEVHIDS